MRCGVSGSSSSSTSRSQKRRHRRLFPEPSGALIQQRLAYFSPVVALVTLKSVEAVAESLSAPLPFFFRSVHLRGPTARAAAGGGLYAYLRPNAGAAPSDLKTQYGCPLYRSLHVMYNYYVQQID
jgi:hypothetical protein